MTIIGRHHAGRLAADEVSAGKVQVTLRILVLPLSAPGSCHIAAACNHTYTTYLHMRHTGSPLFNGDQPFQWEMPKFEPPIYPNPLNYDHQNLHK